jgi:hypothetical protein
LSAAYAALLPSFEGVLWRKSEELEFLLDGRDGAEEHDDGETLDEYKPPHCLMVIREGRAKCADNDHFSTVPAERPPPEPDPEGHYKSSIVSMRGGIQSGWISEGEALPNPSRDDITEPTRMQSRQVEVTSMPAMPCQPNIGPIEMGRKIYRPKLASEYVEPDLGPDLLDGMEIIFQQFGKSLRQQVEPLGPPEKISLYLT